MSFETSKARLAERVNRDLLCTEASCGCDSCPAGPSGERLCQGPSPSCDAKNCSTICSSCRAVCNRRPDRMDTVRKLGGTLSFQDVRWRPFDLELPGSIAFQLSNHYDGGAIPPRLLVVNVRKLYRPGNRVWHREKDLRRRFKVPDNCLLAISFTAPDELMDPLADDLPAVAMRIAEYRGVDFVFAPNFSTWDNYPRFDVLVNLRRKLRAVQFFQGANLRVVPDVSWHMEEDFERVVEWLTTENVRFFVINCQGRLPATKNGEPQESWNRVVDSIAAFRERLPDATMFLGGVTGPERMVSVKAVPGPLVLIDANAQMRAVHRRDVVGESLSRDVDPNDVFRSNMEMTERLWQEAEPSRTPRPGVWTARHQLQALVERRTGR